MPLVTWDPSFSVKVARCDEDHKKLFALLNSLHDAMASGKGAQVIGKVVKELSDYTKSHFAAEQELLEKTHYPALGPHLAQHRIFVKKVEQFQKDLDAGVLGQAISVVSFLKDWLTNHIKQTDQQYSAHLNANGVR
jgi:hemerythrin